MFNSEKFNGIEASITREARQLSSFLHFLVLSSASSENLSGFLQALGIRKRDEPFLSMWPRQTVALSEAYLNPIASASLALEDLLVQAGIFDVQSAEKLRKLTLARMSATLGESEKEKRVSRGIHTRVRTPILDKEELRISIPRSSKRRRYDISSDSDFQ